MCHLSNSISTDCQNGKQDDNVSFVEPNDLASDSNSNNEEPHRLLGRATRSSQETAREVLSRLRRSPPVCSAPGAPVERSRLLQGIVIFHHPSSPLMLLSLERCVPHNYGLFFIH